MDRKRPDLDDNELNKLYILQNVNLDSIRGLLEACTIRILEPQEILISPKELNKKVYFILSGRLRIFLDSIEGFESIATLETGESAGELSVIDKQLTTAYIVADEECRLLVMDEDVLWSLVQASHAAACNLLFMLTKRLRHTDSIVVESVNIEQGFQHYGSVDALTGLHNRYWFNGMFRRQFIRSSINNKPFSIIMADIDNFKILNESHGHLTGDKVLYEVAHVITSNIRPGEMVSRFGGDEFVILLPDQDVETAKLMADRLQDAMRKMLPIPCGEKDMFYPTLSMGISGMKKGQTPEMLLKTANDALERAKNNGKNCFSE
ncbi:MAG TPA: GGDEF domain-containing protein [Syntrophorhabdaceae bacterium]|nr:GGDEF domain-containing protein [Syntrophorhabdaceae bacterium]